MDELETLKRELRSAKEFESKAILDFAKLVSDMRRAQIKSQRTGRWHAREAAKCEEGKVDEALKSFFGGQKNLFT